MQQPQTVKPPSLRVVLLIGGKSPDFARRCRHVAACARLHVKESDLADAQAVSSRARPLAIVLTHDLYAGDPLRFDAMATEAGAMLVRLESEDVDDAELAVAFRRLESEARAIGSVDAVPRSSGPRLTALSARVAGRAYQMLERDESLRRSLTRAGYAPLLDWASDRALATAGSLGPDVDEEQGAAMIASLLRDLLRASVVSAEVGEVAELLALLAACPRPLIDRELAAVAVSRLPLDEDADGNAFVIACALRGASPADSF
jgi:hypothetical protein